MADDLRILLSASLNTGKSIGDLNQAVKAIEKHPSLQKINLKINIDQDFKKSINSFISAVQKMKKISEEQSKVVSETQDVYKKLDGTITTVTTQVQKSGEVIKKTKNVHDENKRAMQDESIAAQKLTENVEKLNRAAVDSITINRNKANKPIDFNVVSSKGYSVTKTRLEADGQTLVGSSTTTNYKRQREDELKEIDRLNKQAEKLDRDHFNALKDNHKRTEDMEKVHYLALQQNRQKDIDFQQAIAKEQAKINDLQRRFGKDQNVKTALQDVNQQLSKIKINDDYKNKLKQIDIELKKVTASAKTAGSNMMSFAEQFKVAATRIPLWMTAMTAFYAPLRGLQAAVRTIIEVDSQLTQLRRVMDEDTNFDSMLERSIELANELGRSITDVNEAIIGFARQGFDEQQSLALAQSATLAQNISELTPEESISTITSAMTVFNIEASRSISIIDKLNEVDNNFAVTTQDLAIAMNKAGSTAKAFGVDLDQLVGHATAVMTATRESGSVVGNGLKSIYSRLTTMNESEDVLNKIGISLRTISGEVRPVNDILSELASKWNGLSETQKQNTAVTLAGRYQLNRFLALMSNYRIALEATETSINSQGSANEENVKYLDSLQARIERMKVAWQELSLSMGDAVITDTLIILISTATTLGNAFSFVVDNVGLLPTVFFSVATVVNMASAAFRVFILNTAQAVASIFGIPVATTAATTGLFTLTGAVRTLSIALKGLMASTGIGLIFAAIGFGAELLMGKLADTQSAIDETSQSFSRLSDDVASQKRLEELSRQYDTLAEKTSLTAEEKIKLSNVENELLNKYGLSLVALGKEEGAYETNKQVITEKIALMKEEIATMREKASLEFRSNENSIRKDIEKEKNATAEALKKKEAAEQAYKDYKNSVENGQKIRNNGMINSYANAEKFDPNKSSDAKAIRMIGEKLAEATKDAQSAWEESNNKYRSSVNTARQALRGEFQNYVDTLESEGKEIKQTTRLLFDALASVTAENDLDFDSKELQKIFNLFNTANIENIDQANELFRRLPQYIEVGGNELKVFENALTSINLKPFADDEEEIAEITADLGEEVKKTRDELKNLNQVIYDVGKGQSLNGETVADLITQYPELADKIKKTTEGWTIEKSALEKLRKEKLQKAIDDLKNEKASTTATLNNSLARIKMYGIEINAINDVADAKAALDKLKQEQEDLNNPKPLLELPFPMNLTPDQERMMKEEIAKRNKELNTAKSALKEYINNTEEYEKMLKAMEGIVSDPNFGVSTSGKGKGSKGEDPAEKARKERQEAFNEHMSQFKYLAEMQNWSTQEQIDGLERIKDKHSQHLKENIDAERQLNLELKNLREQRYNDELHALDRRIEKMRQNGATEVQMEREKLKLYESQAKRTDLTQEQRDDVNKSIFDTRKNIDEARLNETKQYFEKRNALVEEHDKKLKKSEQVQSRYKEGSKEYIAEEQKQISILEDKKKALHEENEWIRKRLAANEKAKASEKLTAEQVAFLTEQLEKNSDAWYEADNAIRDSIKALEDIQDSWEKSVRSSAKDAMDVLEEFYEKQGELAEEALDKELQAFKEYIDGRKKLLNRDNAQEDFNKKREKLQKEEIEIRKKIDVLKLDDSWEATSKRENLEKDLQSKLEEIAELELDRSRKMREDNYDDQLEAYEKDNKAAKEAADKKWRADLEKDEHYSALKQGLLENNVAKMDSTLLSFSKNVQKYMDQIGDSIQMNLIEKLDMTQNFQGVVDDIKTNVIAKNPNNSTNRSPAPTQPTPTNDTQVASEVQRAWDNYLANKKKAEEMKTKQNAASLASNPDYLALNKENKSYRDIYKFRDGTFAELSKSKTPLFSALTGGMTPDWPGSDGKFLLAHQKEAILNKSDTSNLLKIVDVTRNIIDKMKLPNFSNLSPNVAGNASGNTYFGDINVTVQGGDKNVGNKVVDAISYAIRTKKFGI